MEEGGRRGAGLLPSLAAVAAAVALLCGCGGSSSSTSTNQTASFKTGFVSATTGLQHTTQAIGAAIRKAPSQTNAEIRSAFSGLATQWQNQLSQLETLKPPANLAAEFNTLTGAVNRVEADLNAIVSAAATNSASAAEQASANMVTDLRTAKSTATTLDQKLGVQ